ncbi:putative acyl-CoA desaturase [Helianthus annuus]|uniref:Acyl-CoA desaturase n=2 Tax=Helianthus annuus TaxID=4232 RepID=A0A9K3JLL7_HELAN|nr:putative acyl-CoA desaturase [Helianthus annuus]KAJ0617800.1 putative acyl-CoA desaturase [Helianthus annuus]KAJ0776335.1 putative acyl-CoA desaturase [Helianthus annuus]KAJ0938779.1 putative acyl-CoA desaturase [Helianthus annuus]KAJ0950723.1 putative acyl-CoA desaturase [Helianthus annuus]
MICDYKYLVDSFILQTKLRNLASMTISIEGEEEPVHKTIFMSDVVVTRKRNLFRNRKWNIVDVITLIWVLFVHFLRLFAPFTFTWGAFWAAFLFHVLCGMFCITLSYHRNLAHRSLKLPKWLEYTFAYFGVQAAQRDPIFWVSIHRTHHQNVDSDKDPHSPTYGFWFSHIGWLFDSGYIVEKGVRITFTYHVTFLVNSACHIWGNQVWNTGDLSKNNLYVF